MATAINEHEHEQQLDRATGAETLFLLPEEITVNPDLNVRPYSASHDGRENYDKLEQLAKTMLSDLGVVEPLVVEEIQIGDHLEYLLLAGNRRREAGAIANSMLPGSAKPLRLPVIVRRNLTPEARLRIAMVENVQRERLSPMDFAQDCKRIMSEFGYNAAQTAGFLGVNKATVIEAVKLLALPEEVQLQLHQGTVTGAAAQMLPRVRPEKRGKVMEKATAMAKADTSPVKGTGTAKVRKGAVKAKHVIAAAREEEALDRPKPLSRSEIVQWFETQDGPGSGHPNGAIRTFIRYLVDKYITGTGTDRTLKAKWDQMVDGADKGTPEAPAKIDAKAPRSPKVKPEDRKRAKTPPKTSESS